MIAVIFAKVSQRLPNKHMLNICGKPLILRVYETALNSGLFNDVIIYSKNPNLNVNANIVFDNSSGVLIDAVESAIKLFGTIFALGGDMPYLDSEILSKIYENYENDTVYGLNNDGIPEPLLAIYNRGSDKCIEKFKQSSKSVSKYLKNYGKAIPLKEESWKVKSINVFDDYEQALKILGCY